MNLNILCISYTSKIPFGANTREVRGLDNKVIHRNTTWFFRSDLVWDDLAAYMDENFKNSKKVDVYSIGCSDGSEPYSLATILRLKSANPAKFLPIMASDYDSEIIKTVEKGVYPVTIGERSALIRNTGGRLYNYFENDGPNFIKPKKNIKKDVNFSISDAISTVEEAKYGDNVFLCRNFWPYLRFNDRIKLIKRLKEKMNENSLLVIGTYDRHAAMLDRTLQSQGFKNIEYAPEHSGTDMHYYTVWKKY